MTTPQRTGLVGALVNAGRVVAVAAKVAPGLFAVLVIFSALLALAPAAQVLATAWLVRAAEDHQPVLAALIALALAVAAGQVLSQAANMQRQRIRLRMRRHFQDALMRAVAQMSPRQLADPQTTSLIHNGRESTFSLGELVGSAIGAVGAIVTAGLLCWSVSSISPLAGVLVVLALFPILVAAAWEAKIQGKLFEQYGHWGARSDYALEQIVKQQTGTELISLGTVGKVADIADAHRTKADVFMDRLLRLTVRADMVSALVTALLLACALFVVEGTAAGGAGIAAGVVGVIAGLLATRDAGFAFGDIISYAPKVSRFAQLVPSLGAKKSTVLPPVVAVRDPAKSLTVTGISVTYPSSTSPALTDFSLSVRAGEMVALVGANGAGKSTAVNAITGIVDITAGQISVDGIELGKVGLTERLALFAPLSQDFGRYEFTIRHVVALGVATEVTDAQIWTCLQQSRADDFVRAFPDGLDTQLGEQFGGTGLSGGQWQRLALARIYLRDAAVWILDEPTSAIDAETEQEIFAELGATRGSRITIVVSHRAWTLRPMDRIYVLDQGRVVEHGTFDELVALEGRFAQLFNEQIAGG